MIFVWILLFLSSVANSSQAPEVPKLQSLIQDAKPHAIIEVPEGHYQEAMLVIDKPLTLRGKGHPVLDGMHQKNVILIKAPKVTIEGFRIIRSGSSDIAEYAGVRIEEADNCLIQNNIFEDNIYSIYLAKSKDCQIKNNIMKTHSHLEATAGNGIHLWNSKNIHILNNTIEGHRDGIYIEFSTDSLIERNVARHNIRYGLHFMYSSRNHYIENTFSENQTGVAVMYSKNIKMIRNRFMKSWGRTAYGLLLKDISDSEIRENTFFGNTVGILLDAANRNQFSDNLFKQNGWALTILGNSEDSRFIHNQFISNFFDATTNASISRNTFDGNYWSSYRGYDLNRDGIGDIPYHPMKVFGCWVTRFPELTALLGSPVVEFLEIAERVFPILTPVTLLDPSPLMRPFK